MTLPIVPQTLRYNKHADRLSFDMGGVSRDTSKTESELDGVASHRGTNMRITSSGVLFFIDNPVCIR